MKESGKAKLVSIFKKAINKKRQETECVISHIIRTLKFQNKLEIINEIYLSKHKFTFEDLMGKTYGNKVLAKQFGGSQKDVDYCLTKNLEIFEDLKQEDKLDFFHKEFEHLFISGKKFLFKKAINLLIKSVFPLFMEFLKRKII